ncbi:MAG: efflux RND transporter permease subunit [Desulfobacterales bacterium]|nr:efflux RND transporter permease subunit [Desulfobacterales bacterium]
MHKLSEWFIKNPVAANLAMGLILVAGLFTMTSMRIEGFPPLPPSSVTIDTAYPGATAEQVDRGISRRIEMALEGMPGIKRMTAASYEGYATVTVQKVTGMDMDRFQNEIKTRIDGITTLPGRAERPSITRDELTIEALLVQVYGKTDTHALQETSLRVKEALLADPTIAKIGTFGLLPREIIISVDEEKLGALGLSLSDLSEAIGMNSLDYKTGILKSRDGIISIKADRKALETAEFNDIPIKARADGSMIRLRDVAELSDGFGEYDFFARYQGKPSVGMMIFTSKKGHLLEVSEAAHQVIDRIRPDLPAGLRVDIWGESSIYMTARLNLLVNNAFQGLAIVFVLLALFLNLRLAFWVAMGIPISVCGALTLMGPRFLDHSLNDITTFGLIIVLGILVDDAVVVGESVFEERQKTPDPVAGTLAGVGRVSTATIFGCATTMTAFYPLLLIDNDLARIFAGFSVVVITSLAVSLLESKLILPAHLTGVSLTADDSRKANLPARIWGRIQGTARNGLDFANRKIYTPVLRTALAHRYASLVALAALGITAMGMIYTNEIRTVFFPEVPGQFITVNMEMIKGSPMHLTRKNLDIIEDAALAVNREAGASAGTDVLPPIAKIMSALEDASTVEIWAELQPEAVRQMDTMETLKRWREKTGELEGVRKLTFSGTFDTAGGFELNVSVRDQSLLPGAVNELMESLADIDGVKDIHSDLDTGMPQIRLILKPYARHLGLTISDLAGQIGDAFGGLEVQRFLRRGSEVKVFVKYKQEVRRYMGDLMNARIRTPQGQRVPLPAVAEIRTETAPGAVHRKNRRRTATIGAAIDKNLTSPTEVMVTLERTILPELTARYPELSVTEGGELEEIAGIKSGMIKALIFICLAIYALLAIPLKSYWQPFVIMSVIPFGFVGAAFGHRIMDYPLSILSFFGMLGVAGVVVNDSLVMITRFNDLRTEGMPVTQALIAAGTSRFRAVFLTTATTVSGLLPLMSETSENAQYLIPAAISLAFGELIATPVTLIMIPLILYIADDVKSFNFGLSKPAPSSILKYTLHKE